MNIKPYRSEEEAYPFLSEDADSLLCDFEIKTDELASLSGLLMGKAPEAYREELKRVTELIYHFNPTLRTFFSVTEEEMEWLQKRYHALRAAFPEVKFVLPAGGEAACIAHLLRVGCKALTRLMYRAAQGGRPAPDRAFDFANLLSNYFFYLALELNRQEGIGETEFVSRNYPG